MTNEKLNTMFEAETETATTNHRGLTGTAQLTTVATEIANDIVRNIDSDFDTYAELFKESKTDSNALDKLISETYDLSTVDVEFLKELDEATLDGMLKSQQSKRSRAKGKAMTLDNYRAMLVGAIAENLIRLATGKPKTASGARRAAGVVTYTAEELEEMAKDQERVRRELRNVQSKKSIMKRKADFNEEDPHWQELLEAEAQLKSIREASSGTRVVMTDETKNNLKELFGDTDISKLKASDSKAMLEKIQELIAD